MDRDVRARAVRRAGAAVVIALVQVTLAFAAFGYVYGMVDAGRPVPWPARWAALVLAFPGVRLGEALRPAVNAPGAFVLGLGAVGLGWGTLAVWLAAAWQRRRGRGAPVA